MAHKDLEDKLVKIEKKLGGDGKVPPIRDLEWHLDTIEGLIGGGGPGGTSDHAQLSNRDAADQHPISSITDLQNTLNSKAAQADLDGKANAIPIFPVESFDINSTTNFSFTLNNDTLAKLKANTERTIILEYTNDYSKDKSYYTFSLKAITNNFKSYSCTTNSPNYGLAILTFSIYQDTAGPAISGEVRAQTITGVNIDDFNLSAEGYLSRWYNTISSNTEWHQYPVESITPEQLEAIKALLPTKNIESVKTLDVTGFFSSEVRIYTFDTYLQDESNNRFVFPYKLKNDGNDISIIWTDEEYYYIAMYWTVDGNRDLYLFRATFNYSSGDPGINIDLYFSDFDLSGDAPVVINQEKAEKLKSVLAKDDKDFIYLFADFPYLVDQDNIDTEFGGKMSFYPAYILGLKAFVSLSSGSANSQIILFGEFEGEMRAIMSQFPEWYTEALFTAMATDPTKHISLKFTAGSGSSNSGSSVSSPVLYRHRTLVNVYEASGEGGSTQQAIISFLSKYSDAFVTDGSLVDLFTHYADYSDEHSIINPMLIIGNTFYYVSNINPPDMDGIKLVISTSTGNTVMGMNFADNASGLTDEVTSYVEASGGSTPQPSTPLEELYNEVLVVSDSNGDEIVTLRKTLMLKTEDWYYGALDGEIQQVASNLGLTIPTVVDANGVTSALNTILQALQQAGQSSQIPNMFFMWLLETPFVIKMYVGYGTFSWRTFGTGDYAVYYLNDQGTFTDVFTRFDTTQAYSVSYLLTKVNLDD